MSFTIARQYWENVHANWINGLVAALPDGVIVVDAGGVIILCNERAELIFGYEPGELTGRIVEDLVPTDSRSSHPQFRSGYFQNPTVRTMGSGLELYGRKKDGTTFPVDISLSTIEDAERRLAIAVMRDITERKRLQEMALRESEDRFRQLAESIQEVFWLTDPSKEEMLYISPAYEAIWERKCDSLYLRPQEWLENIHPEDRERVLGAAERKQAIGTYNEEYRILRPDGSVRWISDRAFPITDEDGKVVRIAGVARDITDRKNAEEDLQRLNFDLEKRAEQFAGELTRFFTVSVDMLCISSVDGYFKRLSPSFTDHLGWSIDELLTTPYMELIHPDDIERTREQVILQIERGEPVMSFENRYRHKDGSYRVLSWKSVPQDGGLMFAVARDITNQKQFEAELQTAKDEADKANQAKSEFLSRMSHELRTPLNAVLGFAQLLDLQYEDARIKEATRAIIRGGKHLLELVNEILEISRIETGNLSVSLEPVPVGEIVSRAVVLIQPIADASGITVKYDNSSCSELHVLADHQRLLQIIVNLLSNALKYNRKNGLVTVSCTVEDDWGVVDVSDTGTGIAPENQAHLFEPFHRFCDPSIEGTGLGLALALRFAAVMGGRLSLHKSSPEGSTFRVELQRTAMPSLEPELMKPDSKDQRRNTLSGVILCIEDNPSNLRLLEMALSDWDNLSLLPAAQGTVGLELAKKHKPDLILLDLHLPDMPGEQVLQRLKSHEETRSIPVIIVSADATVRQVQTLMAAGAASYLTKPLDLNDFFDEIELFLNAHRP